MDLDRWLLCLDTNYYDLVTYSYGTYRFMAAMRLIE
jgi:hypothetical protein